MAGIGEKIYDVDSQAFQHKSTTPATGLLAVLTRLRIMRIFQTQIHTIQHALMLRVTWLLLMVACAERIVQQPERLFWPIGATSAQRQR